MELLDISKLGTDTYIVSSDNDGIVNWHKITNITRHDPSEYVYQVRTKWGREVTVVASESLLIWNEGTKAFEPRNSEDVRIGDKMPTTFTAPNVESVSYVSLRDYLPDTKYMYGTDYNGGKYSTRKKFEILDGRVYTKCAKRNSQSLQDRFELNRNNGFFIGLYLAEGNTCKDYVGIANNDFEIQEKVRQWFDDNGIKHKTQIKKPNEERPGLSTSVRGYSTLLVQFLERFLGKYSQGKYVPNEAYLAPDEFVQGLIDGYISGDGCVTDYHVVVTSVSKSLIHGISQLLARYGIFSKISTTQQKSNNIGSKYIQRRYNLSIQSKYVYKFGKSFTLTHKGKQDKLNKLLARSTLDNMSFLYEEHNNVILDKIVSINKILASSDPLYHKVYDITVPSTLNFQLFNGLQVRDTSDVGYIQRKLVKAMEDCKINHDLTVRNASGAIVQFLYGEDGMNSTKLEAQVLGYIEMDLAKMESEYLISHKDNLKYILDDKTLAAFQADKGAIKRLLEHYEQIIEDREFMITKVFDCKYEKRVFYPISLMRILRNCESLFHTEDLKVPSDLSPVFVLDCLEALEKELYLTTNNPGTKLFGILLRAYLSPKLLLFKHRFSKLAFEHVVQQIKLKFYEAIAHPSEMVGVVAAQSIGEPATQLCSLKTTRIIIMKPDATIFRGTIGDFIDDLLTKNSSRVVDLGHDSVAMNMSGYKIIGVGNDEKTSWKEISEVSRHPANGGMVRVHTYSGKTTCATRSHSFLKRVEKGIVPVLGSDLKLGDRIPVSKLTPTIANPMQSIRIGDEDFPLDHEFGWFCGAYAADGYVNGNVVSISKIIPEYYQRVIEFGAKLGCEIRQYEREPQTIKYNKSEPEKLYRSLSTSFNHPALANFLATEFGNGSYNKKVGAFVYASNLEFIRGVIGGYFDGDGNVNCDYGKQMVRSASVSETLTEDMIILLSYVGLFGSKCLEVRQEAERGDLHTIQISRKYARQFKDEVGFVVHDKAQALDEVINYVERDDAHNHQELIDKIPELGDAIAYIGKTLALPGQSRNYGRWTKKESIGRSTLLSYITLFEEANAQMDDIKIKEAVADRIDILKQAAYSDVVWDEITHIEYLDDPKEFVYDFTVPGNDSFMVDCNVLVHNTLNSVEWNTELLLRHGDGSLHRQKIGEFIDNNLLVNKNIEEHPHDTKLGWTKELGIHVLSCDENGKVDWNLVEAVTRHPVVNEDGTNTLLKVKTSSGREVIATKAKSFLKRVNNKIIGVRGEDLNVGDCLPVSTVLPTGSDVTTWNVSKYLDKHEWLFMSEVEKATTAFYQKKHAKQSWFGPNQGKTFTVPYSRGDAFMDAFGLGKASARRTNRDDRNGCVYPKISGGGNHQSAHIPEHIPLDSLFGFFIGAYLSEGSCTEHHILIANVDDDFNCLIDEFSEKYGVNYHIDDRIINGGRSKTLRLHSMVLAQLLIKSIGTGSANKRIPAEFLAAPDDFLKGLIDGYFSGDGHIPKKGVCVTATSVCRGLLEDIQQILTKFGIQSGIKPQHAALRYNRKKGVNAQLSYMLYIGAANTVPFRQHFTFTLKSKQHRMDIMNAPMNSYAGADIIPNVETQEFGTIDVHRSQVDNYIRLSKTPEDKAIFEAIKQETIIYDKVVSIEEVENAYPHAYDLTVEGTRNFNLMNGLAVRDTFHSSGISAASKTVRGVPRIKELLSVSKNIKTPALTIFMDETEGPVPTVDATANKQREMLRCNALRNNIKTTYVKDLIKSSSIFYSPSDTETDIEDDKAFVNMYRVFGDLNCEEAPTSPWLLRLEFDNNRMFAAGLTMQDIHFALYNFYEDNIQCMFSDDNADKLIFRIRLRDPSVNDVITELKALEQNIIDNVLVRGVKGIHNAQMTEINVQRYNHAARHFEKASEWVIGTYGTNLQEVLGMPDVDPYRTVSNNVHEIYHTLGIEGARQCLINEISECLADVGVNFRHLALLADVMTYKGALLSIDRHGINRSDIGPLAKCSFEETSDMLIKAGTFAEYDPVNGVSANIMLGQIPPCGTGDTTVMIDEEKLLNILPKKQLHDIDENMPADEVCTMDNLEFDFSFSAGVSMKSVPESHIMLNVI